MIKLGELELYDIDDLSKKLKVTSLTLRTYINKGKLKGQKVGQKWYVSATALQEFFEGDKKGAEEKGAAR